MEKRTIIKAINGAIDKFEKKEDCSINLLLLLNENGVFARALNKNGQYSKDRSDNVNFTLKQVLGVNYSLAKLSSYDLDTILFDKIKKLKTENNMEEIVCIFNKDIIVGEKFYIQGIINKEKKVKVIDIDKIL